MYQEQEKQASGTGVLVIRKMVRKKGLCVAGGVGGQILWGQNLPEKPSSGRALG